MVVGARPDEDETRGFDALGKIGIFGEKAVTGVDRFGVGHLGRRNDGGNVQVTQGRLRRANTDRFVGQFDILGFAIRLGVHNDRLDTQFAAGTLHAKRNFASVGDKNFPEHSVISQLQTAVRRIRPARRYRAESP